MVLSYIWVSFFLIAFVVALVRLIFFGDVEVFPSLFNKTMEMSKLGFEIALGHYPLSPIGSPAHRRG